ncbi:hypothetical protein K501DRAFT_275551 [Backusella circina FSU 941]|nr:hypothetical protein K501DRAFT_275551 [Backusella circina FSU 941]
MDGQILKQIKNNGERWLLDLQLNNNVLKRMRTKLVAEETKTPAAEKISTTATQQLNIISNILTTLNKYRNKVDIISQDITDLNKLAKKLMSSAAGKTLLKDIEEYRYTNHGERYIKNIYIDILSFIETRGDLYLSKKHDSEDIAILKKLSLSIKIEKVVEPCK